MPPEFKRNANHDRANYNIRRRLVDRLWSIAGKGDEDFQATRRAIKVAENMPGDRE